MGDSKLQTTLQRPYLLRAMHEWMTDNVLTPHIVIDVAAADSNLPVEYAKDGQLVVNVSYSATQNLFIGNERVSFDARFGGVSRHLDIPILAVVGVYARESGQGMIFSGEQVPETGEDASGKLEAAASEPSEPNIKAPESKAPKSRPQLKIIK
jgi:stringent starvation protein B